MARTENIEIPTLNKNGIHYISNTDKAEALSNQFKSNFTSDHGPDPEKGSSPYPDIPDIDRYLCFNRVTPSVLKKSQLLSIEALYLIKFNYLLYKK